MLYYAKLKGDMLVKKIFTLFTIFFLIPFTVSCKTKVEPAKIPLKREDAK